jgi:hypothetical protein
MGQGYCKLKTISDQQSIASKYNIERGGRPRVRKGQGLPVRVLSRLNADSGHFERSEK